MPATTKTYRDLKQLHRIFCASGVLLLIASFWLLLKDHRREWKMVQRRAAELESQTTSWRQLQFQTEEKQAEYAKRRDTLDRARRAPLDPALLAEFLQEVQAHPATQRRPWTPPAEREEALADLRTTVRQARMHEDQFARQQRSVAAERDAAAATLTLLIRDQRPLADQQQQQLTVDRLREQVAQATRSLEAAQTHRRKLEELVQRMTAAEDLAVRDLDQSLAEWRQLQRSLHERRSTYVSWYGYLPLPGRKVLELPILDLFNSPRKIETLWNDDLEIDYNLVKVRRYDRCTTCHQLLDRTAAGTREQPAFPCERTLTFALARSASVGARSPRTDSSTIDEQIDQAWGLRLAAAGLAQPDDVCVQFVWPNSPAAQATLVWPEMQPTPASGREIRQTLLQTPRDDQPALTPARGLVIGDILVAINGQPVPDRASALQVLSAAARDAASLRLTVRRGLPAPFNSHPRLDLFVGSYSPHPLNVFGCTVCHEGQGSATEFKWASHSPNSTADRSAWRQAYHWFDNPDWRFPMLPQRFVESTCLKCHPDVVELAGANHGAAPAPKVTRGHQLIQAYGCFGCHEINGFRRGERIGPDLRPEPNVTAVASQLRQDPGFAGWDEPYRAWIQQLIQDPWQPELQQRVREQLLADARHDKPRFAQDTRDRLLPLWKLPEVPGRLRPAGPSLRSVGAKLDRAYTFDWIRTPSGLRPDTRMPHAFGLWNHLESRSQQISARFEPVEILAMTTYLFERSQPFAGVARPAGIAISTAAEKISRGKILFQERGCLACHTHRDFAEADSYREHNDIVLGPDLSAVAPKFQHSAGRAWLFSWLKDPTRYHPRTRMPQMFLDPLERSDGKLSDPAEDIVEYLLSTATSEWQPAAETTAILQGLNDQQLSAVDEMTLEYLRDTYAESRAEQLLNAGSSATSLPDSRGAEWELVTAGAVPAPPNLQQKLLYIGRKSLARYGCVACHDIPGLEDAKPIGPVMTDWGRKDEQQLAFESVIPYLSRDTRSSNGPADKDVPSFFWQQIVSGHRAGFAYQKLREPRSYDYRRAENKRYTERLRMPQFTFSDADREAIITFLLGLVADPPRGRYRYQPDAGTQAQIEGRKILDQYRCGNCHVLEPERWHIDYAPGRFGEQPSSVGFPFLHSYFPVEQLARTESAAASGFAQAALTGMPALDTDGLPLVLDDEGLPLDDQAQYTLPGLEFTLDLWRPAALDGNVYEVGVLPLSLPGNVVSERRAADGGFLAKYLLPHVVQRERTSNSATKGTEAWGWLPPPIHAEGAKVQTGWLHDYLLNPAPIRPAVVLRMPRYNLSAEEATQLARYFAARDGVEYPYEFRSERQADHLAVKERQYQEAVRAAAAPATTPVHTRLASAFGIVTNNNYCVKCHRVGDYEPQTSNRSKAPDLAQVYSRLRPAYVRNWIANPKSVLPYTGMPVNIPYDPRGPNLGGISQELYRGSSVEQLEALVDLLLNFDEHAQDRAPVTPLIK